MFRAGTSCSRPPAALCPSVGIHLGYGDLADGETKGTGAVSTNGSRPLLTSKIGATELKMACIAVANNALFLTANRRDFEKVPGLRFED